MAKGDKNAAILASRLKEIAETRFETLSDDEVLNLLAERKRLLEIEIAEKKKEEERAQMAAKEKELKKKIETLNTSISPEKEDEELLHIVEERKKLEAELDSVEETLEGSPQKDEEKKTPVPEEKPKVEAVPEPEQQPKEEKEEKKEPEAIPEEKPEPPEPEPLPKEEDKKEAADFGSEGIVPDAFDANIERYTHELEANHESLGSFLQNLPEEAKKSKKFMLKVAAVDPAYAMHYADQMLKKDEDFNIRIAGTPNKRNSGNALAEMLPEARTGKVVLAATRTDYRNVRFLQPAMAEYDEILTVAKKGALERVSDLKEAADVTLLIPKVLQKDKAFMAEVEKKAGKTAA